MSMEQVDNVLPINEEENSQAIMDLEKNKAYSPLLTKVRNNFSIYGIISILFGGTFTLFFYKAGIGFNVLIFAFITILLLQVVMKNLSLPIKRGTKAYYIGTLLLGASTMLTSSWILQFLNVIGMLLLLDLSLIHQINEDSIWNFPKHLGKMISLLLNCFVVISMPFKDCFQCLKNTKLFKNEKFRNIIVGIVIALPLMWVVLGLLSSADLLFGKITHQLYNFIFSSNLFYVCLMTIIGFLMCYCILCSAVLRVGNEDTRSKITKANASIAVTVLLMLCIVYIIFCSVQVLYLFSNGLFVLPKEFTFAEYARRGFFELLTVTVINIVLMLICTNLFEESKTIRFFLTIMTVCTYIMIGSAVYRMLLYIGAYNLTFLRLFVLLFLLIDFFVLAGVIVSVYRKGFPLFGYCVTVVTVSYLLFSFAKPDYWIASYHISEKNKIEYTDIVYLTQGLSLDAAPIVVPFLSEEYKNIKIDIRDSQKNYDPYIYSYDSQDRVKDYYNKIIYNEDKREFRDFNLSYYLALRSINNKKE